MAWIVQPLQRKGTEGAPLGLWHLCADSDEGGGFYAGCDHDHTTAEEARGCLEARKHIGEVTGFPLEFDLITINGSAVGWVHDDPLTYEKICELAGKSHEATVTYFAELDGDLTRRGSLCRGQSVRTAKNMHISCMVTGSA